MERRLHAELALATCHFSINSCANQTALISVEIRLIRFMMDAMIVSNKWNLINGSNVYILCCVINCLMWVSQESKVTATTSLQWRIGGFQSVVRYSKWTPKGICEKKIRFLTPFGFSQFLKCYCCCQLSKTLWEIHKKTTALCLLFVLNFAPLSYMLCFSWKTRKLSCNATLTFDPLSIPSVFIGWTLLVPVSWSTHTIWHLLHLPCV